MSSQADDTNWAVNELADAELGDLRRTKRLVELAHVLVQHPTAARPEACGNDARLKAAYRVFSNDDIAPQDVLASHIESTSSRLAKVPLVLAVQDTTEVDWTGHPATTDWGPLGHPACQGLHVHSTLAFTPEGLPLGLMAQPVWARDPNDMGKRTRRKQLPISQKESQQWLTSLEAVHRAHEACPQTRCVSMGDREADVSDLLAAARPAGSTSWYARHGTAVWRRPSALCGPPWRRNRWGSTASCTCPVVVRSLGVTPGWRCGFAP